MVEDSLLKEEGSSYLLTENGEKEAKQVLRAHRLWEAYLESIGAPEQDWHTTAHHLEHMREEETVDYLSEVLGKPKQDPHGQKIPGKTNDE